MPVKPAGKKAAFPKILSPMLATLVDEAFDEPGWVYEVKWDGYRAVAHTKAGKASMFSRNNKSFDEKFYPVHAAVARLGIDAVMDGEIVVLNKKGLSDFGALQNWRSEADGELKFYVFDLLWLNGYSLIDLPLTERKQLLKKHLKTNDTIQLSESFDTPGRQFFATAQAMGLEGIIAKKTDSTYAPGLRSREWLKIKVARRQEVVIGGYTTNEGTSKPFSSLLVGVYDGKRLHYTGKIGTGFNIATQKDMLKSFKKLVTKTCPFTEVPDVNKPSRFRPDPPKATVTWLKPQLVCEVSYLELTTDGVMRHPSFEGMRIDKKAASVVLEKEKDTDAILKKQKIIKQPVARTDRKTLLNPTDKTQVRKVNGHELTFNNVDKYYWPKDKVTKRDMLNYYYQVAPYILPYLKDRPQSMNRYPGGINGIPFYQKDIKDKAPGWLKRFPYRSEDEDKDKEFLVVTDEASILYMASLGTIEMNPWSSTIQKPDNPDWCIIDLDPDKHHFDKVIEAAQVTRGLLNEAGIDACCKTSGSTGIHIYIPLGKKYTYEDSREFGRVIARLVQSRIPKFTSIERLKANRRGKMYIDFLQNRPQATLACAYSLRPKPGAPVSMPLYWEEVRKGLKMTDFNIHNAMDRIRSEGDIFKPVLGKGIAMKTALKKLDEIETKT
jgi:bifunctional non-homologous end joining protein LigD